MKTLKVVKGSRNWGATKKQGGVWPKGMREEKRRGGVTKWEQEHQVRRDGHFRESEKQINYEGRSE